MTYAISAALHAEAALQIFRASAPERPGPDSIGVGATVRSPDPRTGLTVSTGAADAIFALVQARAHTSGSHGSARGEGWAWGEGSSTSGEAAPQPDDAPRPAHEAATVPVADTAKALHPHNTAAQTQGTVSVSVETLSVGVSGQRPPKDVRERDWWENAPDARKFLDAAYRRLGEGADTPRSLDDWCTKIGFLGLNRGTLSSIADRSNSPQGMFTLAESLAAQNALSMWDRVWGDPR